MTGSLLGQASITILFVSALVMLFAPHRFWSLMGAVGILISAFSLMFCCPGFLPYNKIKYPVGSCVEYNSTDIFTSPGYFQVDSYLDNNWKVHLTILKDTPEEIVVDHYRILNVTDKNLAELKIVDCKVIKSAILKNRGLLK